MKMISNAVKILCEKANTDVCAARNENWREQYVEEDLDEQTRQ